MKTDKSDKLERKANSGVRMPDVRVKRMGTEIIGGTGYNRNNTKLGARSDLADELHDSNLDNNGFDRDIQVVKIGSACLFDSDKINESVLSDRVYDIENAEMPTFVVVSGAIALGKMISQDNRKNADISDVDLMSYSSAGQKKLMDIYGNMFTKSVAQLLVTEEDMKHENHIRELIYNNFKKGFITLVNYNDCVDFKQLRKDNDTLAAQLLVYTGAKRLILLGKDYDGFCDKKGKVIPVVKNVGTSLYSLCEGVSKHGNGGFKTKLDAANIVLNNGSDMIISNVSYKLDNVVYGTVPRTLFSMNFEK